LILTGSLLPLLHDRSLCLEIVVVKSGGYDLLIRTLVLFESLLDSVLVFIFEQLSPWGVFRGNYGDLLCATLPCFEGWTGGWAKLHIRTRFLRLARVVGEAT